MCCTYRWILVAMSIWTSLSFLRTTSKGKFTFESLSESGNALSYLYLVAAVINENFAITFAFALYTYNAT